MSFPSIGEFSTNRPIELQQVQNGGWVVWQHNGEELLGSQLGAYSNTGDMLAALSGALIARDGTS